MITAVNKSFTFKLVEFPSANYIGDFLVHRSHQCELHLTHRNIILSYHFDVVSLQFVFPA